MLVEEERIIFRETSERNNVFLFLRIAGCCSNDVTNIIDIWTENKDIREVAAAADEVKIMDLANRLIRFYGYEPGVNMQVKVTGLRPGEKLYEELLMDSEQDKMAKTAHNKIFIAPPMQIDLEKFYTDLQRLKDSALHNSDEVVDVLQEMVPTYHPNRRVRADHTVVAATGNTALFSREEIAQKLRETEHPAEEG